MNILDTIISEKKKEIIRQQEAFGTELLLESEQIQRKTFSMSRSIRESASGIIAEFKRRSPSKGWIHPHANVIDVVTGYEKAGAAASSILTDEVFFGGMPGDLVQARQQVKIPLLRKDFIIDEYQIYQAKAIGADAILLIASAISRKECKRFATLAHQLGLEVLLELHDIAELDYADCEADMIGVNNRDLTTFETKIDHSFEMIKHLPSSALCISESGISDPNVVFSLRQAGFEGFLMGENFMKHEDPQSALANFIGQLTQMAV
ncbi:indole-3-glycerol phosphate synthase TrpC [Coprobacter tertius]|uniref:indole-3-glycerol-phosphate synthase n=1 Tax=Coprobacter tertius TaxID=2944915 RepID=A0ABT1MJW5_9BACT|nr:indole-3-glycerol phosphate synthase TrpC [Coprobacter tertius]MCP9612913.1 indole-3-glycerol phosphate synthase TrpC [Coprobacter tertius]